MTTRGLKSKTLDDGPYLILVAATVTLGLWIDTRVVHWGQLITNVLTLTVFGFVLYRSTGRERRSLLLCTAIALAGELFLALVWGLYTYRLGNLPLFVPPGHALLFFAGVRVGRRIPAPLARAIAPAAVVVVATVAGPMGYTSEWLWLALFFAAMLLGKERRVYSVMLPMALALELWGTHLGAWSWSPTVPWLGLRGMNPPLTAGAFYCVLDLLVLLFLPPRPDPAPTRPAASEAFESEPTSPCAGKTGHGSLRSVALQEPLG